MRRASSGRQAVTLSRTTSRSVGPEMRQQIVDAGAVHIIDLMA